MTARVRALATLGLGALILGYAVTGRLAYIVTTRYESLILGSAVVLVGAGAILCAAALRPGRAATGPGGAISAALVLGAVIVGVVVVPRPLSGATATARGIDAALSGEVADISTTAIAAEVARTGDTARLGLADWLSLLARDPAASAYIGKPVDMTGLALPTPTLPAGEFALVRFKLNCCSADARPVGLPVRYDPARLSLPKDGTWLRVRGTMERVESPGRSTLIIALDRAERIEAPANPYIG